MLRLDTPVQFVKGIGPRIADLLAAKGIQTVEDLLYYLPFRYEDRLNPRRIGELRPGEMASVIAEVRTSALFRTRRMPLFELTVGDPVQVPSSVAPPLSRPGLATQGGAALPPKPLFPNSPPRSMLKCIWFHGSYLKDRFQPGQLVALYGKVEQSKTGRERLQLINPQFEILDSADHDLPDGVPQTSRVSSSGIKESTEIGRIVPIYESAGSGKVTSRWFRRVIHGALENLAPDVIEAIPDAVRRRMSLMPHRDA